MSKKLSLPEMQALYNNLKKKYTEICIFCFEPVLLHIKGKYEYVYCSNNICLFYKKQKPLWKNTPFEKIKIPHISALSVLELWINNFTRNQISFLTGINEKSIYHFLKKVTDKLVPYYYNSVEKIGGVDCTVECDESKFGKRKFNRGHPVEGVWVLGYVKIGEVKQVRLIQVEKRDKITLTGETIKHVERGTTVRTDCWKGYVDLDVNGYNHQKVNHSENFVDRETGIHTNTIEGTWSGVKRNVPIRCRTKELINPYLVRYMIRKNESGIPFTNLIKKLF